MRYYRLMSMLPPLPDTPQAPPISLVDTLAAFDLEMTGADRATALAMLAHIDCSNVESLLQGREAFDERGPAPRSAIEERRDLPDYLASFLERYDAGAITDEYPFDALWRAYCSFLLDMADASGSAFLAEWATFEISLRDSLARYRADQLGLKPELKDTGMPDLGTGSFVDLISAVGEATNPIEQEMLLDTARLRKIDNIAGIDPFSTDAALAYLAAILILDRWDVGDEADVTKMLEVFA